MSSSSRTTKPPPGFQARVIEGGAGRKGDGAGGYSAVTHDISVTVQPIFLEDQSSPTDNHYVWAYRVRIENRGAATVQLRNRHWVITDAMGRIQEVRGAGVVGEQPVLKPGQSFEYTSGTPLPTPSGIMKGTYQMEREDGERFSVLIPAFSLDSPHQAMRLN
ncbi:MAG: Co2+/Mg2+ efflux protein ApaG [Alphaproteobacteria bacterium]|nr:Co2+/Mg2+ efflux protein ApaG [Alphaproteobacteria bacterium]